MATAEGFVLENFGTLLLIGAAIAFCLANVVGLDVLVWRRQTETPGRRAVAHWLPIACVAIVALLMNRPEIAVGIAFSTSVACLSLVMGVIALYRSQTPQPERPRNVWAFVLPAAVMAMLCGFRGHFELLSGGVLLVQGVAVWLVWRGVASGAAAPVRKLEAIASTDIGGPTTPWVQSSLRWVELILGIGIALVGGWAATRGVVERATFFNGYSPGVLAATVLGPLLVFPMLVTGSALSRLGRADEAISAQSGIALLNLCALLPLLIGITYVRDAIQHPQNSPLRWIGFISETRPDKTMHLSATTSPATSPSTLPATAPTTQPSPETTDIAAPIPQVLAYPIIVWRVDTVLLVVLGFMLIPLSLGRISLGQAEAAVLIAVYCGYYLVSAFFGIRMG